MVVDEGEGEGKGAVKGFRIDRNRVKCAVDWAKTDKPTNSRTAILKFDLKYRKGVGRMLKCWRRYLEMGWKQSVMCGGKSWGRGIVGCENGMERE